MTLKALCASVALSEDIANISNLNYFGTGPKVDRPIGAALCNKDTKFLNPLRSRVGIRWRDGICKNFRRVPLVFTLANSGLLGHFFEEQKYRIAGHRSEREAGESGAITSRGRLRSPGKRTRRPGTRAPGDTDVAGIGDRCRNCVSRRGQNRSPCRMAGCGALLPVVSVSAGVSSMILRSLSWTA